VKNIHRLCPTSTSVGHQQLTPASLACPSATASRRRQAVVVTEFGPPGVWETQANRGERFPELTSTEKAALYQEGYRQGVSGPRACASVPTPSPGATREADRDVVACSRRRHPLGAVDAPDRGVDPGQAAGASLSGHRPPAAARADEGRSSATVKAALTASDPKGDALKVRWVLHLAGRRLTSAATAEERRRRFRTRSWPRT